MYINEIISYKENTFQRQNANKNILHNSTTLKVTEKRLDNFYQEEIKPIEKRNDLP